MVFNETHFLSRCRVEIRQMRNNRPKHKYSVTLFETPNGNITLIISNVFYSFL